MKKTDSNKNQPTGGVKAENIIQFGGITFYTTEGNSDKPTSYKISISKKDLKSYLDDIQ